MNTQNVEFLKKSLLNLGFGEGLNKELEKAIADKEPEFTLGISHEFNHKRIDYLLNFKAGNQNDMYFFNRYDANLRHPENQAKDVLQSFYINKGHGITAKEAFNLMEGRSVHKQLTNLENQKYQAWIVLDKDNLMDNGNKKIRQYHEKYGFDVEKVISGKGIKEMDDPKTRDELLRSLKKGNAQQITVAGDSGDKKYYMSANPQFKTVDLYDQQMNKVKREELLGTSNNASKSLQPAESKEETPQKKQSRKSKIRV
jgi:hypothetical protein